MYKKLIEKYYFIVVFQNYAPLKKLDENIFAF